MTMNIDEQLGSMAGFSWNVTEVFGYISDKYATQSEETAWEPLGMRFQDSDSGLQESEDGLDDILNNLGSSDSDQGPPSCELTFALDLDRTPSSMSTIVETKKTSEPPCNHNSWDNIRAKRGCMTLRCRDCQQKWKAEAACLRRCRTFANGNCKLPNCPKTHIHRFKQSVENRIASFQVTPASPM
eukprot:TRINITY_DN3479_c1_g2_i1.p1 TRINITY_DN3479_c1_g2~~TRINITY_DN3479_c1_g2_i1.p1  ORF type:complete len:185 (+),score=30.61 TRINITY_DN3479_c1_g2_i1:66-620(+)